MFLLHIGDFVLFYRTVGLDKVSKIYELCRLTLIALIFRIPVDMFCSELLRCLTLQ